MAAASGITSQLAQRYATALFDLARERDALDRVNADLNGLKSAIGESADLRRVLRSPILTRDEQGRAIGALAERAGFDDLTRRFLGVIAEHRRLFALPGVIDAFQAMLAAHRGEVSAEVISAVPLNDEQLGSSGRCGRRSAATSAGPSSSTPASIRTCSAGWSCGSARAWSTPRSAPGCSSSR